MNLENFTPIYYRHNVGNYFHIPQRTNAVYDLTFVLNGCLTYKVNGKIFKVVSGNAILVPPKYVCERLSGENPADFISINFNENAEILIESGIIENALTPKIKSLIGVIDFYLEQENEFSNVIQNLLKQAIYFMLANELSNKQENKLVTKIKKYINLNLKEKITLKSLGDLTYFSPVYLDTLFKKETGFSIIDYAINQKIEYAKDYILEGVSLKNVAEALGFSDYNYFSRLFKKRTGKTPIQFKNNPY